MRAPDAGTLLALLEPAATSILLVGSFSGVSEVEPLHVVDTELAFDDGIPEELRVDAALVDAAPLGEHEDLLPLLARLRDVHAHRVVVVLPDETPRSNELVALGFEARKSPSVDGLVFIWDPALANRPREWNNSRHWANPQNFSRYRW